MMSWIRRLLRSDRRGTILVETAMAMPILVLILTGGFEITRFVLLHQKLDRVASSMGDLISQAPSLTESQIVKIFGSVQFILSPFNDPAKQLVVVTSIGRTGSSPPHINWQRTGAGTLTVNLTTAGIGTGLQTPKLPAGFTVAAGETVIVAEVFYAYTPFLFPGTTFASTFYTRSFSRPRLAPLDTIQPG